MRQPVTHCTGTTDQSPLSLPWLFHHENKHLPREGPMESESIPVLKQKGSSISCCVILLFQACLLHVYSWVCACCEPTSFRFKYTEQIKESIFHHMELGDCPWWRLNLTGAGIHHCTWELNLILPGILKTGTKVAAYKRSKEGQAVQPGLGARAPGPQTQEAQLSDPHFLFYQIGLVNHILIGLWWGLNVTV